MHLNRSNNNFWNTGATINSSLGLRSNSMAMQPMVKVAPYTRLNQTKQSLKRMEGYVSDGTAVNLSDPNSMRD